MYKMLSPGPNPGNLVDGAVFCGQYKWLRITDHTLGSVKEGTASCQCKLFSELPVLWAQSLNFPGCWQLMYRCPGKLGSSPRSLFYIGIMTDMMTPLFSKAYTPEDFNWLFWISGRNLFKHKDFIKIRCKIHFTLLIARQKTIWWWWRRVWPNCRGGWGRGQGLPPKSLHCFCRSLIHAAQCLTV